MRYAYLASGLLWVTSACAESAGRRHERRDDSCGFFATADAPVSCTLTTSILSTATAVDSTTTAADPTTTAADPTTTAADSTTTAADSTTTAADQTTVAADCPDTDGETTSSANVPTTTTSSAIPTTTTTSSAVPTTTTTSDVPTTTTTSSAVPTTTASSEATTTATTLSAALTTTTSATTSTATPGSSSGSGSATSGACSPDGQYNCIDGKTYQRCAAGTWSVAMPVAPGPALADLYEQYPINCNLHNWPSASVDSVKEAYSWFYTLWSEMEADAQQCRRIACFGESAVWMCADSLGYKNVNSVTIADKMNELLDGNNGCLDKGNKSLVQGQIFTGDGWSVLVRGGENCSVDAPEQPIFY
ncbi:hypothetical protein GQX73_g3045 [Xylaria multiplex]|uniref:CBM1 domain-containing protein n=1 Tax=Xylaria multiplex TaxID=323545 RepID=A0A7C8IRJ7_9PEZI|nr:hypothetical protein GQX73_g3045 [Xylaria multiplex]